MTSIRSSQTRTLLNSSTTPTHSSRTQLKSMTSTPGANLTSPLQVQERRVNIDLSQTHHSHGESLLQSAPLISRTGRPGSVSNERELSQGLKDEILMPALQVQWEQILAEAKFEIQKYEERASFDQNKIRNLKCQIDSRDRDLRRTFEEYMEASQAKDRLRQEVADRERALQEDRLRGIEEIEFIKTNHEFYVDEFSRTKLQRIRIPSSISWTNCENYGVRLIICMIQRISRTPSQCTVDNSHTFPFIPRYVLP